MEKVRYMISDAADMVHVETHVLRYWEEELELDIPRNEMGHRYYTRENIKEFQKIKDLKDQGYQLKAIRMILHSGKLETSSQLDASTDLEKQKVEQELWMMSQAPEQESAQAQPRLQSEQQLTQSLPRSQSEQQLTQSQPRSQSEQQLTQSQPRSQSEQQLTQSLPRSQSEQQLTQSLPRSQSEQQLSQGQQGISQLSPEERMSQFRELMSDIVGRAIAQNNEELSQTIGRDVQEMVLKEMNYLMREQDNAQEERYRKLDAAIRGNIKKKSFFEKKK